MPIEHDRNELSDGASATLCRNLAPGGNAASLFKNLAAFTARYGSNVTVLGQFSSGGMLDDGGERIELEDGLGNPLLRVTYDETSPLAKHRGRNGTTLELLSAQPTIRSRR